MVTDEGITEYIFKPINAINYWDKLLREYTIEELYPPFFHSEGHCWMAPLPQLHDLADIENMPSRSNLRMCEDGKQLSFSHAPLITIQKDSEGRYSHWNDKLFFSTSDNSNPNTNGRRYTIRYQASTTNFKLQSNHNKMI